MPKLPEEFCRRMKGWMGEEYEELLASYDRDRVSGLRFNALKQPRVREWQEAANRMEEETGFHLSSIPWVEEGFYYGREDRPGKHPFHEAGVYYIQEPSAMAVVRLLDSQPGERILDLCAAPGGKSTQIASRLGGQGLLVSNEIHPARAKILSQNVERMGAVNTVVTGEKPENLVPVFPEFFHRIVVDAPCSGEGMFRKDPEAVAQWSPEHVQACALRQQGILGAAAAMLQPGGRLVYSTCTFAPEENEGTIYAFLQAHGEFEIEPVAGFEGWSEGRPQWLGITGDKYGLKNTFRIFPHRTEGEGHYMAVLRKKGEPETREAFKRPDYLRGKQRQAALADFEAFCRESLTEPENLAGTENLLLFGEQLYLVPEEMPDMTGLKVLRPGLHLGTLKKKRFEPSHALALALKPGQVRQSCSLAADSPEILSYLKGNTLPALDSQQRGWVLICVGDYSLGWAKASGGILKNHYPKGLRWL